MYRNIIFDLDGTLVSLEERYVQPILISISEVLGEIPTEIIDDALEDLLSVLGKKGILLIPRTLWKLARKLGMTRKQSFSFLFKSKKNYEENRFTFKYLDGALETLQMANDNFDVFIVTSAFNDELEEAYKQIPDILKVKEIVGFENVNKPKPDPEGILYLIDKYNLNRSESIYVGDLPNDVRASQGAGIDCIAFGGLYGKYTRSLLISLNPKYIVEDHKQLQELLLENK